MGFISKHPRKHNLCRAHLRGVFVFYTNKSNHLEAHKIDLKIQPSTAPYQKDVFMEEAMDLLRKSK